MLDYKIYNLLQDCLVGMTIQTGLATVIKT